MGARHWQRPDDTEHAGCRSAWSHVHDRAQPGAERRGSIPDRADGVEGPGCARRLPSQLSVRTIPEKWLYLITLAAPSGTSTYRVLGERVLHFRVGASVQEPWRGRSPLTENCVKLPAAIENVLRKEAALPPGKIFKIGTLSAGSEQHQEFIKMVRNGGIERPFHGC